MEYIKIPQDRIGALIGDDGETKKLIEKKSDVRLDVDSSTGEIHIVSSEDAFKAMRALDVVKAIGRGFSPRRAMCLLEDDFIMLEVMDLSKATSTPKELKRVMGRIIGKRGKTRSIIETLADTRVSVYGKTVSIIGYPEHLRIARKAVEMLIEGAPHGTVYRYLEQKRDEIKRSRLDYYELTG